MAIDLEKLSPAAASVLRRYDLRAIPLVRDPSRDAGGCHELDAASLFAGARDPTAALSGMLLFLGCWQQSHEVSQENASREGSYWHAIAHRIEPDSANAAYWFRRVGEHAIFPELRAQAATILEGHKSLEWKLPAHWEPQRFLNWCDEARQRSSPEAMQAASAIQDAECSLLFHWCAERKPGERHT